MPVLFYRGQYMPAGHLLQGPFGQRYVPRSGPFGPHRRWTARRRGIRSRIDRTHGHGQRDSRRHVNYLRTMLHNHMDIYRPSFSAGPRSSLSRSRLDSIVTLVRSVSSAANTCRNTVSACQSSSTRYFEMTWPTRILRPPGHVHHSWSPNLVPNPVCELQLISVRSKSLLYVTSIPCQTLKKR